MALPPSQRASSRKNVGIITQTMSATEPISVIRALTGSGSPDSSGLTIHACNNTIG